MTRTPHIPVMKDEVVHALAPRSGGLYVDGTFGAGGHSRVLLEAANCRVVGLDQDPEVRPHAEKLASDFTRRFTFIPGCFSRMDDLLAARGLLPADGILLDLGVSSMQLDSDERGFSFSRPGPLDMRMTLEGPSAADVVNETEEKVLADILYLYGEERKSRRIARAIDSARKTAPICTTDRLADIVRSALRGGKEDKDPATRTFQALRIYVNRELEELETGLEAAERALASGGRLAVISFHSLEDRRVKTFFRDRSGQQPHGSRHLPPDGKAPPAPTFSLPTKRARTPGDAEISANPRARSARLRVGERTDAPAHLDTTENQGRIQ